MKLVAVLLKYLGISCLLSSLCLLHMNMFVFAIIMTPIDMTVPKKCSEFLVAGKDDIVLLVKLNQKEAESQLDSAKLYFENPVNNKTKMVCDVALSECKGQVSPEERESPGCLCEGDKSIFDLIVRLPAKTEYSRNAVKFDKFPLRLALKTIFDNEYNFTVEMQVNNHLSVRLYPDKPCPTIRPSALGNKTYFRFSTTSLVMPVLNFSYPGGKEISVDGDSLNYATSFQTCANHVVFQFSDRCNRTGRFQCPLADNLSFILTVNKDTPVRFEQNQPCPSIIPSPSLAKTFFKFCAVGIMAVSKLYLSYSGRKEISREDECILLAPVLDKTVRTVLFRYEDTCGRNATFRCSVGENPSRPYSTDYFLTMLVALMLAAILLFIIISGVAHCYRAHNTFKNMFSTLEHQTVTGEGGEFSIR